MVFCTDPPINLQVVDERMEEWYANIYHLRNWWSSTLAICLLSLFAPTASRDGKASWPKLNFLSQENLSHLKAQAEDLWLKSWQGMK